MRIIKEDPNHDIGNAEMKAAIKDCVNSVSVNVFQVLWLDVRIPSDEVLRPLASSIDGELREVFK